MYIFVQNQPSFGAIMKRILLLCMLMLFTLISIPGVAQFSISRVTPDSAGTKITPRAPNPLSKPLTVTYESEARNKAEKKRLRKERNTLTITTGLNLTQTKFDNWAPGGTNTFTGYAALTINHVYARNKIRLTTNFDSKYGMTTIAGKTTKGYDYFNSNFTSAWAISKNWSYSANIALNSQWSKGWTADHSTMVSNIFSPAYIPVGVGLTYQALKKVPIKLTMNILNTSTTLVLSDTLSKTGAYGVDPGKHQKTTFGSSLRVDLNQPIAKGKLNYVLYLFYSTNYEQNNYVEWQGTLTIRITKIIAATVFNRMIYNEVQVTPYNKPLQWNYSFGLGLTYVFKNK